MYWISPKFIFKFDVWSAILVQSFLFLNVESPDSSLKISQTFSTSSRQSRDTTPCRKDRTIKSCFARTKWFCCVACRGFDGDSYAKAWRWCGISVEEDGPGICQRRGGLLTTEGRPVRNPTGVLLHSCSLFPLVSSSGYLHLSYSTRPSYLQRWP